MAMMTIQLNNTTYTVQEGCFLAEVLQRAGYLDTYFAVAINKQFIPRTNYAEISLNEGDCVEVVSPMQGG